MEFDEFAQPQQDPENDELEAGSELEEIESIGN